MTQQQKLRRAFLKGAELTSKQIRAWYGIASPTKVISEIRMENGIAIKSRRNVDSKGRVTHKFYVGRPSREIVAAGYRAKALGLV